MTTQDQEVVDAITAKLLGFRTGDKVIGKVDGYSEAWRGVIVGRTHKFFRVEEHSKKRQGLFLPEELKYDYS